jgi:putative membrane protein
VSELPANDGWRRLHPASPVVRIGRLAPAVFLLLVLSNAHSVAENQTAETDYLIVFAAVTVVYGYIHWMVTRWRFEGDTLRIETGFIRKDSRRLPLARIQGVDVVRPLLGRLLGVSELRIRLAGSGSTDGKLAYLSAAEAADLKVALLAGHRTTQNTTSAASGLPIAAVSAARLLASVLLSLVTIILVGTIASLVILDQFKPKTAALLAGVLAVYLLGFAGIIWRRLSGQYNFTAVEGPDGVHIQRGLLQTISETIPYARIQAVRQVEPLLWRPFGWCRLEVDIAGATRRNQRSEGTAVVRKALLPVGSQQDTWHLIARLLGGPDPARTPPPRRAMLKAPLSFHFLSAGHDETHAVCVTGRINRATTWVPLEKSQSIRRVQGPLQRPLGLATVRVDVAGRRTRAEFRDRSMEEADMLVDALTVLSRAARRHGAPGPPPAHSPDTVPSGWYPDPSGRHEQRYWHDGRWTAHVGDGGRRTTEVPTTAP